MTGFHRKPLTATALIAVCASLALPGGASAQIAEIVVTARKREENLQDVPISVSAFGDEQLQQQGLFNDNDVANFTVNFNTLPTTGRDYDRPVIRGMAAPTSRGEANASYFIDGIYVSTSIGAATTGAVERVEILRGPQSAQFGRATFSGAINYVTRQPTEDYTGRLKLRAGTHDDYETTGYFSGPIIDDTLLFLVSGSWSSYGGEWRNNLREDQAFNQPATSFLQNPPQQADRSRLGDEETRDLLLKLVWTPWEGGEFNFKYGYTEVDDGHWPSLVAPAGEPIEGLQPGDPRFGLNQPGTNGIFDTLNCWLPPAGRFPLPTGAPAPDEEPWWRTSGGDICGRLDANGWENRINLPDIRNGVTVAGGSFIPGTKPGLQKTLNRYLLEYRQGLGDWLLTYRGGANTEDFANAFDLDHTEARAVFGLFNFDFVKDDRDWSSELRLASPAELPVRGEVGAFYYDRNRSSTQRSIPGPQQVFLGNLGFPPDARRDIQNVAYIGSLAWDLAEQWRLDLEGRYAAEDVDFSGGNGCQSSETYYNFTPRISLTYKPTDDLRFYVQAANGDKPGDVNSEFFRGDVSLEFCEQAQQNTTDVTIEPEEQWTYEIGAKTQWWDRRIQANLAVFWIEWEKQSIFQVQ
ncbi:MAG: TonB-dependent receptor, partial [Gammaproteobacteria bacterium]|nr:TonB-dependent receptor [Gammaproteobacteria bacterium]